MTMGERIRQARVEAGLSQRQLAGESMTRNMLSALEHDTAKPSVSTLQYLSEKLCKPISFFFGETDPSLAQMESIRGHYADGAYQTCLEELETLDSPLCQPEREILRALCLLALAERACQEGKKPYSRAILEKDRAAIDACPYFRQELTRRWLIASARAAEEKERAALVDQIPVEEEVLLLRAGIALSRRDHEGAKCLLLCAGDRENPQWKLLTGQMYYQMQEYAKAVEILRQVEEVFPHQAIPMLEVSCRELGDYKLAYYYAKKEK